MNRHIYAGLCPDETQPDSRDPSCPACTRIEELEVRAEAAERQLAEAKRGCNCGAATCRTAHTVYCCFHALKAAQEGAAEHWQNLRRERARAEAAEREVSETRALLESVAATERERDERWAARTREWEEHLRGLLAEKRAAEARAEAAEARYERAGEEHDAFVVRLGKHITSLEARAEAAEREAQRLSQVNGHHYNERIVAEAARKDAEARAEAAERELAEALGIEPDHFQWHVLLSAVRIRSALAAQCNEAEACAEALRVALASDETTKRLRNAISNYCSCPMPRDWRQGDPIPERCTCDDRLDGVMDVLRTLATAPPATTQESQMPQAADEWIEFRPDG